MKPILFSTEMVRAILEGRKTVTRRVINPRYCKDEAGFQVITTMDGDFVRVEKIDENECGIFQDGTERYVRPPYQPNDILWVRETWCEYNGYFHYKESEISNDPAWLKDKNIKWSPSIYMPCTAARIFLRVIDVKVEQLQDITQDGAIAEGFTDGGCTVCGNPEPCGCDTPSPDYVDGFV